MRICCTSTSGASVAGGCSSCASSSSPSWPLAGAAAMAFVPAPDGSEEAAVVALVLATGGGRPGSAACLRVSS